MGILPRSPPPHTHTHTQLPNISMAAYHSQRLTETRERGRGGCFEFFGHRWEQFHRMSCSPEHGQTQLWRQPSRNTHTHTHTHTLTHTQRSPSPPHSSYPPTQPLLASFPRCFNLLACCTLESLEFQGLKNSCIRGNCPEDFTRKSCMTGMQRHKRRGACVISLILNVFVFILLNGMKSLEKHSRSRSTSYLLLTVYFYWDKLHHGHIPQQFVTSGLVLVWHDTQKCNRKIHRKQHKHQMVDDYMISRPSKASKASTWSHFLIPQIEEDVRPKEGLQKDVVQFLILTSSHSEILTGTRVQLHYRTPHEMNDFNHRKCNKWIKF